MASDPAILIIEGQDGNWVAVKFSTTELAREWEDRHPEITARGCIPLVPRGVALKPKGIEL